MKLNKYMIFLRNLPSMEDLPPSFARKFSDQNIFLGVVVIFVLFSCISLLQLALHSSGEGIIDEGLYHYPNMENFYYNGLGATFNSQYSAANTPLPYVITSFIAHLSTLSLSVARLTTALISFGVFWIVFALLKVCSAPRYTSLIFLFYPYFFLNSFVFYVINYGLLFILLAFLVIWYAKGKAAFLSDLLTGIFLSLAVLCQQFYLAIPAAITVYRLWWVIRQRREGGWLQFGSVIGYLVILNIPLLLPLYIFSKWGGLTHPNFHIHSIGFYPSTVVGILFVTGFYFSTFLLCSFRSLTKAEVAIGGLLSVLLVAVFRPKYGDLQGPGIFTGLTHHIIFLSGKLGGMFPVIVMASLVFSGIMILTRLFRSLSTDWEFMLFLAALLLGLVYACNTQIGERHLIGYMTILFLLILPRLRAKIGLAYLASMTCLGVGYFIYSIFFKYAFPPVAI